VTVREIRKKAENAAPAQLDVEGYRARVADAVGMAVVDLIGQSRQDPTIAVKRMIAAYFLFRRDHLVISDIETIMAKTESWVRYATDYIERRTDRSYAFRTHIEQEMAAYALANK
jgi:hypothetical protein